MASLQKMNRKKLDGLSGIFVFGLLSLQAVLLAYPSWTKNLNQTEVGHLGATVYFWNTFRFDVFHVNPPLTRMITGLPLAICSTNYDGKSYSPRPRDRCEWSLGRDFLAANRPEQLRWCIALARWFLIPLLLLGGYYGCRLSRELYGSSAALLFLTLWCFSPFFLSWGATICPDAVAAALGILAVFALLRCLHDPSWYQTMIAGVCLGLLPLAKITWSIAFGLWPLIWLLWVFTSCRKSAGKRVSLLLSLRRLVVLLLVGLWTLNMGYFFEGTFRPLGQFRFQSRFLTGCESLGDVPRGGDNRFSKTWLGKLPVPLPTEFVQGIDTQRYDFDRGFRSYLRGQWTIDHGWWYYYLYALAVKVPLGTWCLALLAVGVTIFGRGFNAPWRDEMVVLVPGLVILVFVSSQTGFSMHSRYVIPALPFFFIWISKVARVFEMRPLTPKLRALAAMIILAITWIVSSSLWAYPHSLSYFNELTGGPKGGGEHLLDSNIDWGQDLLYLKDWLDEHPDVKFDGLVSHNSYPTTLTGIPETPHPPTEPKPGWYAVSVNYLYGRDRQCRYFLDYCEPVASAGYSIYIYHITLDDANRVRRELGLPEIQEETPSQQISSG